MWRRCKDNSTNHQLLNHKAVCRTAPATTVGWCLFFSTMEPPVFVLPLSCWFQNCFGFQDWTYFSGRHKLLTTLNHKGPPLWWKILIFFKPVFDSLKEASWSQHKTPQLLTMYGFRKNQEIPPKITIFSSFGKKMVIFRGYSRYFFRNHTLLRAGVFCIAFSASGCGFREIKNSF